jgi:hypothetical protein
LGPLASLSRVDACNPLLQAHPNWARDEHEGRGIPTSLTPVSGRLASPPFVLALALDPSRLGHAATLTRRPKGPPGLGTPTISDKEISKAFIPCSWGLLEPIKRLREFINMVRILERELGLHLVPN